MILLNICNKNLIFNKKSNEKMGRGAIQMSFQRYGQQVHEKALNIINHQGNIDTNQNIDTTSYLSEWILLKRQQVTSSENPHAQLVGIYTDAVSVENGMEFPQKIKNRATL